MHQITELPEGNFPTFRYEDGEVHMKIGEHRSAMSWGVPLKQPRGFKRHGIFTVVAKHDDRAYVRVQVPRKGWNAVGSPYSFTCAVPVGGVVTVARGKFFEHPE